MTFRFLLGKRESYESGEHPGGEIQGTRLWAIAFQRIPGQH